jgi:hypothetical protein
MRRGPGLSQRLEGRECTVSEEPIRSVSIDYHAGTTIGVNGDVHVNPTAGGWEVRLQYELCAASVHATRRSAVAEGRMRVSHSDSTLFIHGIDGSTVIEHAGTRAMSG